MQRLTKKKKTGCTVRWVLPYVNTVFGYLFLNNFKKGGIKAGIRKPASAEITAIGSLRLRRDSVTGTKLGMRETRNLLNCTLTCRVKSTSREERHFYLKLQVF